MQVRAEMQGNEEAWIPIQGFEDLYSVSDQGRVKRTGLTANGTARRVLRGSDLNGYPGIFLWKDGASTCKYIHRLVAEHFIGPPPPNGTVNHKDGDKKNNALGNLEYATFSENNLHAYAAGLKRPTNLKLTAEAVIQIVDLHRRHSYAELAGLFQVGVGTIAQIFYGRTWRHVTGFPDRSKGGRHVDEDRRLGIE